jgi:hypothetical protein
MLEAAIKPNFEGSTWWHVRKAELLSTMSGEATYRPRFLIVKAVQFKAS